MRTLLIVDDEAAILKLATLTLKRDYHILTAMSGEQALDLFGTHPVDALITDYRMGGMTGVELIRACRALRPDLPFLLSTGYATDQALLEATTLLASGRVLHKPWRPQDLRDAVAALISVEAPGPS